eukprot:6612240-Alexandrium_andersonii.AAC.1
MRLRNGRGLGSARAEALQPDRVIPVEGVGEGSEVALRVVGPVRIVVLEDTEEHLPGGAHGEPGALHQRPAEGSRHLLRRVPVGPAADGAEHHCRAARGDRGCQDGLRADGHIASDPSLRVPPTAVEARVLRRRGARDEPDAEGGLQER